jgi:hypothetical protein
LQIAGAASGYNLRNYFKKYKMQRNKIYTGGARVFAPNYLQGVQVKYFRYTGAHAGAI